MSERMDSHIHLIRPWEVDTASGFIDSSDNASEARRSRYPTYLNIEYFKLSCLFVQFCNLIPHPVKVKYVAAYEYSSHPEKPLRTWKIEPLILEWRIIGL